MAIFALFLGGCKDDQDDAARQAAVRRRMQGIARQASLDPGDGIEL